MPPSRTQINCPRCKQQIVAQVEQLFDVTSDPGAKQRLLGGVSNYAACPHCGYAGALATPIVYHDAEKELLLTYFPSELSIPVNEQEKTIGPLINQILNKLPPEKRKAYLLQPKSFLTYQSLIENILGADGITPEMIQAQQKRVALVEKLIAAQNDDRRKELIKQESGIIDNDFFAIFSRLLETAAGSGQEEAAKKMGQIQQLLMEETEVGKQIAGQVQELEAAVKTLQSVEKELTRDKLLEIIIEAPNETRLSALVSMTRPALDYVFFQTLSERIEKANGEERSKLEKLRETLLDLTRQIDQRAELEYKKANEFLGTVFKAEDIEKTLMSNVEEISDTFINLVKRSLQDATQQKDEEKQKKLEAIVGVLQKLTAPPPEYELLQTLLEAPDESALGKLLEEHNEKITPDFTSFVASLLSQADTRKEKKMAEDEEKTLSQLEKLYKTLLKYSMQQKMK